MILPQELLAILLGLLAAIFWLRAATVKVTFDRAFKTGTNTITDHESIVAVISDQMRWNALGAVCAAIALLLQVFSA